MIFASRISCGTSPFSQHRFKRCKRGSRRACFPHFIMSDGMLSFPGAFLGARASIALLSSLSVVRSSEQIYMLSLVPSNSEDLGAFCISLGHTSLLRWWGISLWSKMFYGVSILHVGYQNERVACCGRVIPKNVYRQVGRHVRFHSIHPRIEMALNILNLNLIFSWTFQATEVSWNHDIQTWSAQEANKLCLKVWLRYLEYFL